MIRGKSDAAILRHAQEVQARRFISGKHGMAKSVRRWIKKQCAGNSDVFDLVKIHFVHTVRWIK